MKQILLLTLFLLYLIHPLAAQESPYRGQVISQSTGSPLAGALVEVSDSPIRTVTNSDGHFELPSRPSDEQHLLISYLGHVSAAFEAPFTVGRQYALEESALGLDSVTVVSTGYQELPMERATGSFAHLGRELLERKVSPDLLSRLEDLTPGLITNRGFGSDSDPVSIRGRSTLFAETMPLIVIDGFPYDGPWENLNPNDFESITVLRDAAAASIWGARAGNGVIVISTKQGDYGEKTAFSLNSSVNITEKNDLFYRPQMDIGDFVGIEQQLYEQGFYDGNINQSSRPPLSPVVEGLIAHSDGLISGAEKDALLQRYASQDAREDLSGYYYRQQVQQQYSLQARGGSGSHRYQFAAGYDRDLEGIVGNANDRLTLNTNQQWKILGGKGELLAGMHYIRSQSDRDNTVPNPHPYEKLVDENGLPKPIISDFSSRYKAATAGDGFLDWDYVPLEEIGRSSNRSTQQDIRLNTGLDYNLLPGLKAKVMYQYWQNQTENRQYSPVEAYSTRLLINRYMQFDDNGNASPAVPVGGVLDQRNGSSRSHTARAQLSYQHDWSSGHSLSLLGGWELKDLSALSTASRFYGYDDNLGLSEPVDFLTRYRTNPRGSLSAIPNGNSHSGLVDRFYSLYANAGYSYQGRYLLSASVRRDASNLFGVDTNQKGVPLWSTGLGWIISGEEFYRSSFLPYLKLRATYGYNGNIDKSVSAYTTASYFISGIFNLVPGIRIAQIQNPPNPNLRWEKIGILNLALDFSTKDDVLSGNVEVYRKRGTDLIGDMPFPPTSGISQLRGNFAGTLTRGIDINLQANILNGPLSWQANLLHSSLKETVEEYEVMSPTNNYLGEYIAPYEGRPLFAVHSYRWGGLDGQTGNPIGYLDGEESQDYRDIVRNSTPEQLVYHGSARPTGYGALRNTLTWKQLSFSFNISYRLGYYYRRASVSYRELMNGNITHSDYHLRWQQPGDEAFTQVPSMPGAQDTYRNTFYQLSEVLVEKGDHIRLQDIRLSYLMHQKQVQALPFQSVEFYAYANNLGILWKAAKDDPLDPDYRSSKPLGSMALGLRIGF
ncbi:SusC/RagA family TonB-linked outer membrane protein [Echinicola sp. 20G]|uniref:SusC/RagA family TonB-linked outer membrane protein n=1 Tax=Echinicola sp. 20G TaxID=2781961 RepID=UPI00191077CA|nr:SusC/RagA family TonB-linked outer membrane protein [Echinicola sp. 20G]